MIGHYLLTLTPEQEDAILTTRMRAADDWQLGTWGACLIMAANPGIDPVMALSRGARDGWCDWKCNVAFQYDWLTHRFGPARINTAIRNRILQNQLRRALAPTYRFQGAA